MKDHLDEAKRFVGQYNPNENWAQANAQLAAAHALIALVERLDALTSRIYGDDRPALKVDDGKA